MTKNQTAPTGVTRSKRSDALRNRERILSVAKQVFARDGANASLDEIARTAAIGAGTLYRHFPNRDSLVEAVYRGEVEKLVEAEADYAANMPPLAALRAWMLLFIDHVAEKRLILPAMDTVQGGAARLIADSRGLVRDAFSRAVQRAIDQGDLRSETVPEDFARALIGIFHMTALPDWEDTARRLVDILIAGSRTTPL